MGCNSHSLLSIAGLERSLYPLGRQEVEFIATAEVVSMLRNLPLFDQDSEEALLIDRILHFLLVPLVHLF